MHTSPRTSRPLWLGLLVASATYGLARPARAEPSPARDPAAAEALFRAAITAIDQGDWATACPKFEASFQLDPSAGTSINVARCREHEGKLAQAWAELGRARTLAREASEVRRRELEAFVDSEMARVEKRLPRLRIAATDLPPGAEIFRDGLLQAQGVLGEALPVDPGEHVVEVKAPGHETATWKATAVEGALAEVVVRAGPKSAASVTPPPDHSDDAPTAPSDGRHGSALPLAGVILSGVGLAGLAVGTITGLNAIAAKDDIVGLGCDGERGTCPDAEANRQANDYASRGSDLAAVSTTAFIAGGILVASGASLLIVAAVTDGDRAPSGARAATRAGHLAITPTASWAGGGVWVSGGF